MDEHTEMTDGNNEHCPDAQNTVDSAYSGDLIEPFDQNTNYASIDDVEAPSLAADFADLAQSLDQSSVYVNIVDNDLQHDHLVYSCWILMCTTVLKKTETSLYIPSLLMIT